MRINKSDYLFFAFIAFICLLVVILPSTTSNIKVKVQEGVKFGKLATSSKTIEPDYTKIALKCTILERLDGSPLNVCLGKFYEELIPNQSYVMGQYFNSSSTITIHVPYKTDVMMHELYHAVDVYEPNRDDETQAYEFQKLFIQLKEKNLLYAD